MKNANVAYSNEQVMLAFAYMSYYGLALSGSDECNDIAISDMIQRALKTWQPVKDEWSLVWGPCVSTLKGDLFNDNMMFVLQSNRNPENYVISIRGTNPFSVKDWLIEDFDVSPMRQWPYSESGSSLKPKISKATFVGLQCLQEMQATNGVPGEGTFVLQFFQQALVHGPVSSITVTGHSLGGALAPTFALWLHDIALSELSDGVTVSTVAFAGPTAGNADFAKYSDACFGDRCIRLANSLDVVPHAWNSKSLLKLYSLYARHFLWPSPLLAAGFSLMLAMSLRGQYTQIKAKAKPLKGHYKHFLYNYFAQALYQHVVGYPESMGMLSHQDIPLVDLFASDLLFIPNLHSEIQHEQNYEHATTN